MTRSIGKAGLDLLKSFEQLRLRAYRDSGGVLTIGWGHTADVHEGDEITTHQADVMLESDLAWACECVDLRAPGVTQNQFDALVCLCFNIGCAKFGTSTLLRLVRAGDIKAAAQQFGKWNHDNGKVVDGLTRRRIAEAKLFLTPDPPSAPADFSNVQAGVDTTAPKETP